MINVKVKFEHISESDGIVWINNGGESVTNQKNNRDKTKPDPVIVVTRYTAINNQKFVDDKKEKFTKSAIFYHSELKLILIIYNENVNTALRKDELHLGKENQIRIEAEQLDDETPSKKINEEIIVCDPVRDSNQNMKLFLHKAAKEKVNLRRKVSTSQLTSKSTLKRLN